MKVIKRSFPKSRLRRTRMKSFSRKMVSENNFTINDVIWPVFVADDGKSKTQIQTMPNVYRYPIEVLLKELEKPMKQGLNAIALFPHISDDKKDEEGSYALSSKNVICKSVKRIKQEYPNIGVICDVALDPYTSHAHDGIISNGNVDNDKSLKKLVEQALLLADSGADILAPSDMMDGRVGRIRQSLEEKEYYDTMIMSYAAKYSSSLYGPFREAVNAGKLIEPKNKKSYQMDIANIDEAMHEVAMDISEGADMIMIKPGLPYLDVISKAKELFSMPTFAYQVSGEYSMIMSAVKNNHLEELDTILETMFCFKRAGADGIFTYFTPQILDALSNIR